MWLSYNGPIYELASEPDGKILNIHGPSLHRMNPTDAVLRTEFQAHGGYGTSAKVVHEVIE